MLINYLNVLGGLLALAAGSLALTYEILNWHADNAADRVIDDLTRPRHHARKADLWNAQTLPTLYPWTGPTSLVAVRPLSTSSRSSATSSPATSSS